jgi:hypothetical protein
MQTDLMYWYNLVLDNYGCIQKDENNRGAAPPILNIGTVSIKLQPFYPLGRNPQYLSE